MGKARTQQPNEQHHKTTEPPPHEVRKGGGRHEGKKPFLRVLGSVKKNPFCDVWRTTTKKRLLRLSVTKIKNKRK